MTARQRCMRAAVAGAVIAGGLLLAGCGAPAQGANAGTSGSQSTDKTVHIDLIGKVDTTSGVPGTFTGKDGWPAVAPADFTVPANSTVVLTIKEYDDVNTALPDGSPYNDVKGGIETVDGQPVTSVSNDKIAHTFSIPELGINAPLPMAPTDGFTTVVFTFHTGAAGSYTWRCLTPCGDGMGGMGGAMVTKGWMQGTMTVA